MPNSNNELTTHEYYGVRSKMRVLRERVKEKTPLPRVVDLFCGCGGMSWGAKWAGFNMLAGVDHDLAAIDTYRRNFGEDAGLRNPLCLHIPDYFSIPMRQNGMTKLCRRRIKSQIGNTEFNAFL